MPVPTAPMAATVVFTHQAARMIKTIPPVEAPVRVNGKLPLDTLGAGRTAPSDVVLADVHGQISIQVVADPFNSNIATIVLAFDKNAVSQFVLPFRSFQLDTARSTPGVETFDPSVPAIFPGLGAGRHGGDGGSFWFWEDLSEEGAQDRMRRAQIGVASRAIWTVWLLSAPSPVVQYAQHILETYPNHAANMPKWLREAYPWRDAHFVTPPTTAAKRLPPLPIKPAHLKSTRKLTGPREMTATPDYRNSLVAVDNQTGQILGVLASDITLDAVSADSDPELGHTKAPSEATLTSGTVEDGEIDVASTPRQSMFRGRPLSDAPPFDSHIDYSADAGAHIQDIAMPNLPPSCRTSTASAAFFSAAGSEYGDDEGVSHTVFDSGLEDTLNVRNGPASQFWRRANHGVDAQQRREASQMSDRTSKAETAFEDMCDTDEASASEENLEEQARQHLPRSALRTSEIRSIEDTVWQQALENGDLPIDGAYTHLAAPRSRDTWSEEVSAIELATHDTQPKRQAKSARGGAQKGHMQGGSVLIEFLAGSRIGASIIGRRSAAAASVAEAGKGATNGSSAIKILGLMPILPAHFLSFFGLTAGSESDKQASPSYIGTLTLPTFSTLFGEASDWVSNLFAPRSAVHTPAAETTLRDTDDAEDESRVEQWEYAIPDFDPASLASTPRPVYRRKRPSVPRTDVPDQQPYSVLHIDSAGVGRRAFFQQTHAPL